MEDAKSHKNIYLPKKSKNTRDRVHRCFWMWLDCLGTDKKGYDNKWELETDCGKKVILTRNNKLWKLYRSTLKPHPCGTELGVKCPYCGGELSFYNPRED